MPSLRNVVCAMSDKTSICVHARAVGSSESSNHGIAMRILRTRLSHPLVAEPQPRCPAYEEAGF
jgi:hypothetical protein